MQDPEISKSIKTTIEVSIRLIILFLVIGWCLLLIFPFVTPVIWGIILAVMLHPVYKTVNRKLGNKPKLTTTLLILVSFILILFPSYLIIHSMSSSFHELGTAISENGLHIPPPTEKVKSLPLIGGKLFDLWDMASSNIMLILEKYKDQLTAIGQWMLKAVVNISVGVFQIAFAIVIAGILLAAEGTGSLVNKLFIKIVGEKGNEFAAVTEKTIRNVTKGILGVAVIQSLLLGIFFFIAGIPYAGVWALLCMVLAIIQVGPGPVCVGIIIFLFSTEPIGKASFWSVLIGAGMLVDNVLKPILLGKGAPVPMLVVFIGSLGGFLTSGFLGLFTGAIVLSIGYILFLSWLNEDEILQSIEKKA